MRTRLITLALLLGVVAVFAAPRGHALAADPPTISTVTPNSGNSAGGTQITIYGSGFQTVGTTFVSVGGVLATNVAVVSSAQIIATTPAGVAGSPVQVAVINPDGQSTFLSAFTYTTGTGSGSPGGLWIAGINPPSGAAGAVINITGGAFDMNATASFGGVPAASVVWLTQGYMMVSVPQGAPSGPITITNPNGQSAQSPTSFTYTGTGGSTTSGALSVTSVSPTSTAAGNALAISGTGFVTGATVTVGGFAAVNPVVVSSTLITATAPAGPTGLATIVVTNPGGAAAAFSGVSYSGTTTTTTVTGTQPSVLSISPNVGSSAGGTVVTITGSGFVAPANVTFGGVPATSVTVLSQNQISATAPANPVGAVPVVVSIASGALAGLTSGFSYELAWPRLTAVSPSTGALTGGTTLTLTGTGFAPGATVTIGGMPAATVSSVSPTQIVVTTPAGASGPSTILVTNPGGAIAGLASAFSYSANPQPQAPPPPPTGTLAISSVSPSSGPSTGGTQIIINGSGFQTGASVTVSGITVPATVMSSTQISATTPAVTGTGGVTVTVMNPTSSSAAALPNAFTYTSGGSSTGGTTGGSTGGTGGTTSPVPAGGGLFVFGGGSNQQLVTASGCSASTAVFWTTDSKGAWIGYVPSVPVAVVNAAWTALFPNGIPAGTPIFARC